MGRVEDPPCDEVAAGLAQGAQHRFERLLVFLERHGLHVLQQEHFRLALLDVLRDVIEHPPTPKLVAAPLPLALGRPGLAREPCCVHVDLRHFLQVSVHHVGEQQLRLVDSFQERLALRELVAAELLGDPVAHAQLVQSDRRGIQAGTVGTHFESLTIRPARPPFEIQVLGESLPIYAVTGRPCRWLHTRACCLGRLLGSLPRRIIHQLLRWGAPLQILRG